jgi:hypothetical protein
MFKSRSDKNQNSLISPCRAVSSYLIGAQARARRANARCRTLGKLTLALAVVTSAPIATAQRVNFATYQKVTASGQTSSYGPDFAVDGIASNFHSFRTNTTNNPHWLELTYPREVAIGSAHLYLGLNNDLAQGGLQNFKFQYHNGSAWIDIPGSTVTANTTAERSVIFSSAVTSNRFRLYSDDNGSRTIREIALFPPNLVAAVEQGFPLGTDVRLSLGYKRPSVATSFSATNYPKNAVDGYVHDGSRWLSPATTTGDTLEIDLIDTQVVGSAHLYSGSGTTTTSNPAQNFVLDYWDGVAWQPIPGASYTTNTNTSLVIPFTSPVTTTKIRYRTTTANFARVRELLLFPPRAGGYPLGQDTKIGAPPTAKWDDYSDSSYLLRCGITDGRFLGYDNNAVRFSTSVLNRDALGWQLLLNHRDGSYRIRHNATGKCLALSQISNIDQNTVILEDYTALPHQDWFVEEIDTTYFRIVNASSGMALQTRYGNWTAGNPMVVRPIDGSSLQRWYTHTPIIHPKKGIAATHNTDAGKTVPWGTETWMDNSHRLMSHASWSYSWGRQSSDEFPYMTENHSFNPMQWGDFNWVHGSAGPLDLLRRDIQSNAKPIHVMGFNEPEKAGQGVISVSEAIRRWPRLEALDAPLVAPVPASIEVNSAVSPAVPASGWMLDFATQANALGYRRDRTAVHWYANPDASSLINRLEDIYQAYGKPIWLTEFSVVDWNGTGNWTKANNYNFLAEFMWRAESLPWLQRYSLFQYAEGGGSGTDNASAPRSNTRNADGTLTAFGQLYAGWDGVTSVENHKNYHLHNKQQYRRVQNPASTDLITSVSPEIATSGTQWILIPGTTADTVRIVSTLDQRRLRYWSHTYVGMAPADNLTAQSEWRLVPDQYGWYFLQHPQTSARLRMNPSNIPVHGSGTGSTDDFKWRFVSPAIAENTPPVLATIPSQSVTEGNLLTFTASATDADQPQNTLTYSLVGAPSGALIHGSSGVFTWTPTETQGPGTYNFTVRVSDGSLADDQSVTVTVIDVTGPQIFETWIIAGQSNAEGYGITDSPVSGLTPASTLSSIGRNALNVTHNDIQMFQGTNEGNGVPSSAGLSLPPRDAWHAMTAHEGLAYDWGTGRGNESGQRFGPELAFGFDVQSQLASPIALIKYARGSTSIAPSTEQTNNIWRDFDPNDGGRINQYDKLVSTIQGAVNSLPAGQVLNIRGVIWMQGESDATATSASAYQANLTEFISFLRTDIGTIAAASEGKMTRSANSWNELDVFIGTVRNTTSFRQTVINAQNAVATADANVFTVDGTNGLSVMTVDDWGASGVHYDTAGQLLLGERFADAAISRLDSGVLISESGESTNIAESGTTDSYAVTLTRPPSANVTIHIATDSQVSVSPSSLTFTTSNWNTAQTVTVTAVNDVLVESTHSGSINHSLSSSDLSFGSLAIQGVTVTIIDNDSNFIDFVNNPIYSLDVNERGFNDDPDGDGLQNGIEAFFGTHPGESNKGISAVSTNPDTHTTTFTHPRNPHLPTNLSISYQWSPNLTTWYAGNGVDGPVGGARVTITSQTIQNTTTVTAVSNRSEEKIFFRATASQN